LRVPRAPIAPYLCACRSGKFCRVIKQFRRMNPRLNSARHPFDLQRPLRLQINESVQPRMRGEASRSLS